MTVEDRPLSDVEAMPVGFQPRKRGRKPQYDITQLLMKLPPGLSQGTWFRVLLDNADVRSARRQLINLNFEVSVETNENSSTSWLYLRRKPEALTTNPYPPYVPPQTYPGTWPAVTYGSGTTITMDTDRLGHSQLPTQRQED